MLRNQPIQFRSDPRTTDRDFMVREISVRAKTADTENRSVEAVFTTERPATVMDWKSYEPIDEVLVAAGMRIRGDRDQVPMLDAHSRWSSSDIKGSGREIKIDGNQIVGRLVFASNADAEFAMVREGHLTDVSVGYRLLAWQDIAPGETATVEGKSYTAGARTLRITTQWEMFEISLVPIGADADAIMRAAKNPGDKSPNKGVIRMNEQLRKLLVTLGLLDANATDDQAQKALADLGDDDVEAVRAALKKDAPAPETTPVDLNKVRSEAAKAERERHNAINTTAAPLIQDNLIQRELADQAIAEAWTIDQFNGRVLKALGEARSKPVSPGVGIVVRDGEKERTQDVMGMALKLRCGIDPLRGVSTENRAAVERTAEMAQRYAWYSLMDLCREALRIEGVREPHGQDEIIRSAFSTTAMSHIFTTSINAALNQAFMEAPDTTRGFVRLVPVSNFLTQERIQPGKYPSLQKLPAGKAAKHGSMSTEQETYKVARFASQFVIDEQDIINDRVDLISSVPMEMGYAAGRLTPDLVYSLLLANATMSDSVALFDSGHGNNSDVALDATNLKAGISAMRKQTQNGVNLNVMPAFLITATALDFTARELLNSTQIVIAGTAGSVTERGIANTLNGIGLQAVSDPRLDNGVTDPASGTAYTGLGTRWFLAANPNQVPTIEVGYLAATGPGPRVRRAALESGMYGMAWDISMDRGAKALAHQGLYRGKST